jgi:hypothetical protein
MKQSCNRLPSFFSVAFESRLLMERRASFETRKKALQLVAEETITFKWYFAKNLQQIHTKIEIDCAEAVYCQLLQIDSMIDILRHELTVWQTPENAASISELVKESLEQWDALLQKLMHRLGIIQLYAASFIFDDIN